VVASATRDARRKLPAERHDELLRRAVEIQPPDGLGAVTLRKVAADLGVTPGWSTTTSPRPSS
jgi:DNA-binding transcriptional regulator YbjK